MAIELGPISSGYSTGKINDNFQKVEDELNDNVLRRDGLSPGEANQMEVDLDMNSNRVLNLPEPTDENEAARLKDVQNALQEKASANLISFTPYSSTTSSNVQAALEEVTDEIEGILFGSYDTFQEMQADAANLSSGDLLDVQGVRFKYDGSVFTPESWVKAELWGAVGDGSTDSTSAFNAMFAYLQSIGGGTVFQPSGEFVWTDIIHYGGNLKWISGPDVRYRRDHLLDMSRNDLDVDGSTSGPNGNGNIQILGGTFDGNSHSTYYDGFNAFEIGYAKDVLLDGVTVLDVVDAHAIDLSASENVTIQNCRFLGFANKAGNRDFSEAIQLDPNLPTSFNGGALDGTHSKNIRVQGCYFGANPDDNDPNFDAWPSCMGNHYTANDKYHQNIFFLDNVAEGNTYSGVSIFKFRDVFVKGNKFALASGATGVRVDNVSTSMASSENPDGTPSNQPQGGSGLVIEGNIISLGSLGIQVRGRANTDGASGILYGTQERTTIANNVITGQTLNSIEVVWCDQIDITGNVIDNTNRAVFVRNTRGLTLTANRGRDFTDEFIFSEVATIGDVPAADVTSSGFNSGWVVSGNFGRDIGKWGILLQGLLQSQIVSNRVVNPTQDDDSRGGIQVASSSEDCFFFGNSVDYDATGTSGGAREGINSTGSCSNITMGANYASSGGVANNSVGGLSLNANFV